MVYQLCGEMDLEQEQLYNNEKIDGIKQIRDIVLYFHSKKIMMGDIRAENFSNTMERSYLYILILASLLSPHEELTE